MLEQSKGWSAGGSPCAAIRNYPLLLEGAQGAGGWGKEMQAGGAVPESAKAPPGAPGALLGQAQGRAVSCCLVLRVRGKQVGAEQGLEAAEGTCWPTGACCPPFSIVSAMQGTELGSWMWRCTWGCVDVSRGPRCTQTHQLQSGRSLNRGASPTTASPSPCHARP